MRYIWSFWLFFYQFVRNDMIFKKLTCLKNKWGNFTVKTDYHFIINRSTDLVECSPPLAQHHDLAKTAWKVDTVPKIKHFLWRLLSKVLPLMENLRHRHVVANSQYFRCCQHSESTNDVFFTCNYAQGVWRLSGMP